MKEPVRWVEDPEGAPPELVALLREAGPLPSLPEPVRVRSEARLDGLGARAGVNGAKLATTAVVAGVLAAAAVLALVLILDRGTGRSPPSTIQNAPATPTQRDRSPVIPHVDDSRAPPTPPPIPPKAEELLGSPRPTVITSPPPGRSQGLTATQLSTVVGNGRRTLQRCYEEAIRGMADPPAVRQDVRIRVSPSGTVESVRIDGDDVRGLHACVRTAIRGWRFPPAEESTSTRFPLIFQPMG